MILQALSLAFRVLLGRHLKPAPASEAPEVPEAPEAPGAPETPLQDLPGPPPASPPLIIVPDPAHQDRHGPASSVARALLRKGHAVFENDGADFNLNIVAVRTADPVFDRFRCRLVHFWKREGEWRMADWPWTTFPGHYYSVVRFLNPAGVAILAKGQYQGVYRLDRHRNIYEALCQRNGPVKVYRDGNRDRVYDMDPITIQKGMFGINLHATENPDNGISRNAPDLIGAASAGCLVSARVTDFVEARKQWRSARTNWGPATTVTLIDDNDLDDYGTIPHEDLEGQHYEKEKWSPPEPHTLGIRNRNLLNVKQDPRNPWKFSTGADARGHAIFPRFAPGIRAGIRTLRTYWAQHRLRTLSAITSRWAPASDTIGSIPGNAPNRPDAYAAFLSRRMGVPAGAPLQLFNAAGTEIGDVEQLFLLVSAMVEYENGVHVKLPRDLFDEGVRLFLEA